MLRSKTDITNTGPLYTEYKYPEDFVQGFNVYQYMLLSNIISPTIQIKTSRNNAIEEIKNEYENVLWFDDFKKFAPSKIDIKNKNAVSETRYRFNNYDLKGNILQQSKENDLVESYQWGYNQTYPVAKVINATNSSNTYIPSNISQVLYIPTTFGNFNTTSFKVYSEGDINFSISFTGPPGANSYVRFTYSLTGPVNYSGVLCWSSTGTNPLCSGYSQSVNLPGIPPGEYALSVTNNAYGNSEPSLPILYCSYMGRQVSGYGIKEFYYQSFEDENSSEGNAYAGKKYYTGDFTVPFQKPNAKNYFIDYRFFNGSKWEYIRKNYINSMILSEGSAIDEVRIYPQDAQIFTYTYEPLVGISSETDLNGKTQFYYYDDLGRLSLIRDENKNILKKICYNYSGQPETCLQITYNSVAKSQSFTKNNCPAGSVGSAVTYTVVADTYTSTISQTDADQLAQNDVNANGQNYANTNGTCTFSSAAKSGLFTRNNCGTGAGSSVTYTVAAGAYTSTINQADADQLAQNDVNINGQNYANTSGICTYMNVAKSGIFTRNNCVNGTGSNVTYTVAAGTYSSTISQADADQLAQNDVNTNGQNYANLNGACTQTIYAKISYTNWFFDAGGGYANVWIKFYSDAACTTPYSVSNLSVNYRKIKILCSSSQVITDNTISGSGYSISLGNQKMESYGTGTQCYELEYHVMPGTGYIDIY
ncbi:MAG TPA: DUF5977 domain-containing protein [Chitinophagaceae bacterium]